MRNETRKLTEGAMIIAIVGVFVLIDRQIGGLLSPYILYLYPLPMLLYSAKYGFKTALPVLAGMLFILFIFSMTPSAALYFSGMVLIGLANGSLIHYGASNKTVLISTAALGAFIEVGVMLLMMRLFGYDINAEVQEVQALTSSITNQLGQAPEYMQTNSFFMNMFIISTVLTGVLEGFISHYLGRILSKRFRIKVPASEPIQMHFAPKIMGYIAIAGMIAYYASVFKPFADTFLQTSVQCIGFACIIYLVTYGCIGIYVYFLTMPVKLSRFVIWLIFMIAIMMIMPITAMLGFLYITTDWHKNLFQGDKGNATES